MPNERISMRKIKAVLRLHESQQSIRAISRSLSISPTTASDYLARARLAGLCWPLPDDLDDEALERRLFPEPVFTRQPERNHPDWPYVHRELQRTGVTLQLLWEEYKTAYPEGFQYSWFAARYRAWAKVVDVTMRQRHQPGEKLFVDYAGDTVAVVDCNSGEVRQAQIFVAVLGMSNFTYAEAAWSQEVASWIGAHVRAFEYMGGLPRIVIPDNLRSAISKACRYEPEVNPTYDALAVHYDVAVIPARVRKPRDKAKVEAGVLLVQRWILAVLRNRTFFSLAELNVAIRALLDRLNDKPFKKMDGCRRSVFLECELPVLRPLPATRYEVAEWGRAKVHGADYHVEVAHHYYSAPFHLAGQLVDVRFTPSIVELIHRGKRVASHARSHLRGGHTTAPEHMPPAHQRYLEWTPERITSWAAKKGPHVAELVAVLMQGRDHPQQGFRACMGLLGLEKTYGAVRLDAACRRALHFKTCSRKSVMNILAKGLDRQDLPVAIPNLLPALHDNLRGAGYYSEEDHNA